MTAAEVLAARAVPIGMVIFDCDGVIVDSEEISNRVVAEELTAVGWPMSGEDAMHHFMGTTMAAIERRVVARVGLMNPGWQERVMARVAHAMEAEAEEVPGAVAALRAVHASGLAWRIASNSSHAELAAKFGRLALSGFVAGRVHSHTDVAAGKPAPDLFLHAAAAEGVDPAACVVIEDSVAGATAARAAGMSCLGLDRFGTGAGLAVVGAGLFTHMAELPRLLGLRERLDA